MTDASPTTDKPARIETPASDDFLTKEALTGGSHFKTEEGGLDLPELGGKVWVRGISFREQRSIQQQMPATLSQLKVEHTAMVLSRYVTKPEMSQEEWTKVLNNPNLPATAITRINKKIGEVMDITDEEETAVAEEFPAA